MVNKKVKILGIIPARGGSKSIPKKNIVNLAGKPLIYYAIKAAQESKKLDAFIVSTDSPDIKKVAEKFRADVPFLRPKKYAKDKSRDIEYLQHALEWLKTNRGWEPEIIVMLQPTTIRFGKDIDKVLNFFLKTKADSVRTMVDPGHYNPFKMWVEDSQGKFKPLLQVTKYKNLGYDIPRQLLPKYLCPFGLVYITRAKFIKQGKVWGPNLLPFVVPKNRMNDIDLYEDLKDAEKFLRKAQ